MITNLCLCYRSHASNMKDKHREEWFKETSLKEHSTSDDEP